MASNGKHNGHKRKRVKAPPAKNESAVITLRIPVTLKQRLFKHCQKRSEKEQRRVSYNEALLDLAKRAPV